MKDRVLVIDDEKNITLVVQAMLEREGFEVVALCNSLEAANTIEADEFSVVVTDLYMPDFGGMDVLRMCRDKYPDLSVVMITAFATVESAVAALKLGAFDFVTKPFDQAELVSVVKKAAETSRRRQVEPLALGSTAPQKSEGTRVEGEDLALIGSSPQSPQMQEAFRIVNKIARSRSTVLLLGESGTGKELIAYEIHKRSERADRPFIKVNCAAIPSTLIESELFGHERGAFTGAVSSKPGRFELAHEGTLFLDEIAEMPLEMQAKLLRVLQEQEFSRVGGVNTICVDVRIIAATNKDIESEVSHGRFREDLFYRLNVVPITLPPLRERKQEIEPLVRYFMGRFNQRLGKNVSHIEPSCLSALKHYHWPGNIRQLENVIERMVLMSESEVLRLEDLSSEVVGAYARGEVALGQPGLPEDLSKFKEIVRARTQSLERELIERALDETGWNVTRAAEKLGLSRKGLQLKLKELSIRRDQGKDSSSPVA